MGRSQESRPFFPIREELEFESEEQLSIRNSFNSCLLNQRTKRRVAFVLTAAAFVPFSQAYCTIISLEKSRNTNRSY